MHILIDYRPALRQRTGVGEYVHQLTTALLPLLREGERVSVFSSSWRDRLQSAPAGAARIDLRVPVSVLNLAWHRLGWPPIEWLGPRPDIAWSLHPLLLPTRGAGVVTIHDLYFLDRPEDTVREIRRDYAALAGPHAARADLVVVNSEYTRRQVTRRLGVPADRLVVCHPGSPAISPREEPARPGCILHIGTIERRKNVPALIDAYASLAASRETLPPLVFAGKVTEAVAVPEAIRGRVRFTGYLESSEKWRLLSEASMLVIPSADEGFGMPAVEAMAMGVPVIAAERGALPEVVGEAGILVDPASTERLAGVMARVLDAADVRLQLRTAGIRRARDFSWEASARVLLEAFRAVHARRKAAA